MFSRSQAIHLGIKLRLKSIEFCLNQQPTLEQNYTKVTKNYRILTKLCMHLAMT